MDIYIKHVVLEPSMGAWEKQEGFVWAEGKSRAEATVHIC